MLHKSVSVRHHSMAGKGLFATSPIAKGEIVWRLDVGEPQLTYEVLQKLSLEDQSLAFQFQDRYIICHDDSQYMNHSCDPNTWWISDTELATRRDIGLGEEITYDYVTADVSPPWRASWRCHCGSPLCRKYISSDDCLRQDFQDRYRGHLPSWVMSHIADHLDGK